MRFIPRSFKSIFGISALLLWAFGSTPALATGVFSYYVPIFLPPLPPGAVSGGPLYPYPAALTAHGLLGTVTKVTVTLTGLHHLDTRDLIVILEGPGGDLVKLMMDTGGFAEGVVLVFDDDAASEIGVGSVGSGTYRPESGGDISGMCSPMPGAFPAGTVGSALSVYNNKDPNGLWRLYVCDQVPYFPTPEPLQSGIWGGWSIRFEGATATNLESPTAASAESGIGLIRGWACEAGRIDVLIDGSTSVELPYGTSRPDTAGVCEDGNNGFGGVFNWNLLGDGLHEIRAFVDGVEFATTSFTVTTLGEEYLTGASGDFLEIDFPDPGRDLTLSWAEPHQNFVFVGTGTSTGNPGDSSGDGTTALLESPFSGSSESGVGLIRGWACNASSIAVMIDDDPAIETSYGADRPDTAGVCGDSNNGFGIVVNWNRYPSGVHRLRAFADGSPTPFADVTFNVFNIGVEYLSGVGSPSRSLSNFPAAASSTEVTWSEPHQGVVITGYTP